MQRVIGGIYESVRHVIMCDEVCVMYSCVMRCVSCTHV